MLFLNQNFIHVYLCQHFTYQHYIINKAGTFFAVCSTPGYFGSSCNITCTPGTFGEQCGGNCSLICPIEQCHPVFGCPPKSSIIPQTDDSGLGQLNYLFTCVFSFFFKKIFRLDIIICICSSAPNIQWNNK